MTALNEADAEGGIDRVLGDEGLLDNHWSQAFATCR